MALSTIETATGPIRVLPMGVPTVAERAARGRAARVAVPRAVQEVWTAESDRADPVGLFEEEASERIPELVPIRYGRMLVSPFAFLRGAAGLMARDLATRPHSDLVVQLCGDAHLANFGFYASAERELFFGLNDFDETAPGPFEWDVKRLATSVAVVARTLGASRAEQRTAIMAVGQAYQRGMASFSEMGATDLWYHRISATDILQLAQRWSLRSGSLSVALERARSRGQRRALEKLTTLVDGQPVITAAPPLVVSATAEEREYAEGAYAQYLESLSAERRVLLARYRFADVARKVVGVGSVGTRCWVVLLIGRDEQDPVFLQVKEASESVVETTFRPDQFENHGERIVVGQRLIQASSDIFLGWFRTDRGRDFYCRQLWDMKGDLDPLVMRPRGLRVYAAACAWELARAHARTGDSVAISAYIGKSGRFAQAISTFAEAYATQNASDYEALQEASQSGRIKALAHV